MQDFNTEKYKRARNKVRSISGFHRHLLVFILAGVLLLIIETKADRWLAGNSDLIDTNFESWLDWNFAITYIIWLIVLLVHGFYAFDFRFKFINDWEERKLQELIDQEEAAGKRKNN